MTTDHSSRSRITRNLSSPVCAVRRVIISPVQPGNIRKEVFGLPAYPRSNDQLACLLSKVSRLRPVRASHTTSFFRPRWRPTKPTTQAYRDAGDFARNVRTVEVLIDREAVQNGAASSGTPWQYIDLGHGFVRLSAHTGFLLQKGEVRND
jgi:hypothetical protein